MYQTVIPAQPNETAIEIWVRKGVVRRRTHRIIAWAIEQDGVPTPIGVFMPLKNEYSLMGGRFFYVQPDGWAQELNADDTLDYANIEEASKSCAEYESSYSEVDAFVWQAESGAAASGGSARRQ